MEIGLIRMEWNGVMLPNFLINKLEWQKIRWMIKINEVKCGLGEIGFDYDKTFELLQQNAQIWLMSTLWINIYWMKKKQSMETLFKFQEFHWKVIALLELIPEFLEVSELCGKRKNAKGKNAKGKNSNENITYSW